MILVLLSFVRGVGADSCAFAEDIVPRGIPPRTSTHTFPHLVVHLHYFESPRYDWCKIVIKRTNLAVFVNNAVLKAPPNVTFVVTASSPLPEADEFFASIGVDDPWGEAILPPAVHFQRTGNTDTDLCPRARVIRNYGNASHYLFLNDGARGPFGDEWVSTLAWPFAVDPTTRVLGVVISCQHSVHVQSWAIVVDARVKHEFIRVYDNACSMQKTGAIMQGEVAVGLAALAHGSIAAFRPPLYGFTRAAAECMRAEKTPRLISDLQNCRNPLGPLSTLRTPAKLSDIVFTKFGGSVMPFKPRDFKMRVANETGALFRQPTLGGELPCHAPSSFKMPGTCDRADDLVARGIPARTSNFIFPRLVRYESVFASAIFLIAQVAHLHYDENPEDRCATITKRTNLAVFVKNAVLKKPPNVTFVVTSTSPLPEADEFFASIGVDDPWGPAVLPANVVFRQVLSSRSSLCPRAWVLRDLDASHYLFVDGDARGPFGDAWLETLAWPFYLETSTRVSGVALSCSQYVHVESWAIIVDARVKSLYWKLCQLSCSTRNAVRRIEIDATRAMLALGDATIAALWPPVYGVTLEAAGCLLRKKFAALCKDAINRKPPSNLTDVVFTMFFNNNATGTKSRVFTETAALFQGHRLAETKCRRESLIHNN
ncbi:hypothetical protein CTAYLR_010499 [Chrysophaeum taylorii]|uniref:Uncharacterized protein n=1 Tax=Chrysophaeum taylorii TaxID=2483200 RepID=A0AAD7XKA2_9STRA|nr:hypothetical protein CTAYLR_010499 [Chrysophaeum taylorii]